METQRLISIDNFDKLYGKIFWWGKTNELPARFEQSAVKSHINISGMRYYDFKIVVMNIPLECTLSIYNEIEIWLSMYENEDIEPVASYRLTKNQISNPALFIEAMRNSLNEYHTY